MATQRTSKRQQAKKDKADLANTIGSTSQPTEEAAQTNDDSAKDLQKRSAEHDTRTASADEPLPSTEEEAANPKKAGTTKSRRVEDIRDGYMGSYSNGSYSTGEPGDTTE